MISGQPGAQPLTQLTRAVRRHWEEGIWEYTGVLWFVIVSVIGRGTPTALAEWARGSCSPSACRAVRLTPRMSGLIKTIIVLW